MQDLLLDTDTHDLVIDGYRAKLVAKDARVRQQVKQRLLHFTQEWFLNLQAGTPWIESILVKGANQNTVTAILKARITETEGVRELTRFSIEQDGERGLAVAFSVNTVYNTTVADSITVAL